MSTEVKFIELTQGQYAMVDEEDYERLNQSRWHFDSGIRRGYAARIETSTGERVRIHLHRLVINAPADKLVDHINGDKLDNRKANLRLCSHSENMKNYPRPKTNKSGYVGVYWHKKNKRWCASIALNGKNKLVGCFLDKESAAFARDEAAKKHHGEFARLNFPCE